MEPQLDYGNWVRKRSLAILGLCTLGSGVLLTIPYGNVYRLIVAIVFLVILISFLIPLFTYVAFSQKGGGSQEKVYNLIIHSLGSDPTSKQRERPEKRILFSSERRK